MFIKPYDGVVHMRWFSTNTLTSNSRSRVWGGVTARFHPAGHTLKRRHVSGAHPQTHVAHRQNHVARRLGPSACTLGQSSGGSRGRTPPRGCAAAPHRSSGAVRSRKSSRAARARAASCAHTASPPCAARSAGTSQAAGLRKHAGQPREHGGAAARDGGQAEARRAREHMRTTLF